MKIIFTTISPDKYYFTTMLVALKV